MRQFHLFLLTVVTACKVGDKVFAKPHASNFYEAARIIAASPANDRFKLQWEYQPLLCTDTSTTYNPLHHACVGCAQNCYRFSVEVTEYCSSSGRCRTCKAVHENAAANRSSDPAIDEKGFLSPERVEEIFKGDSSFVAWGAVTFVLFLLFCYLVQVSCVKKSNRAPTSQLGKTSPERDSPSSDDVVVDIELPVRERGGVKLDRMPGLGRRNWWETGKDALSFSWTRGATQRLWPTKLQQNAGGAFGKPTTVVVQQGALSTGTGVGYVQRNPNGEANWPVQPAGAPEMIVVMHPLATTEGQRHSHASNRYQRSIAQEQFEGFLTPDAKKLAFAKGGELFRPLQNAELNTNAGSSRASPSSPARSRSATPPNDGGKRISTGASRILTMSEVVNGDPRSPASYRTSAGSSRKKPPRLPPSGKDASNSTPRSASDRSTPRSERSGRSGGTSSGRRRRSRRREEEGDENLRTPRDSEICSHNGSDIDTPRDSERGSSSGGSRRIIRGRAKRGSDVMRARSSYDESGQTPPPRERGTPSSRRRSNNSRTSSKGSDSPRIVRGWDLVGGEMRSTPHRLSWAESRQREVERRLSNGSGVL